MLGGLSNSFTQKYKNDYYISYLKVKISVFTQTLLLRIAVVNIFYKPYQISFQKAIFQYII